MNLTKNRVTELLSGKGVGRPLGLFNSVVKHTWLPARSKTSVVVLRFIKGQLHQLWVSLKVGQAKWKPVPKKEETYK